MQVVVLISVHGQLLINTNGILLRLSRSFVTILQLHLWDRSSLIWLTLTYISFCFVFLCFFCVTISAMTAITITSMPRLPTTPAATDEVMITTEAVVSVGGGGCVVVEEGDWGSVDGGDTQVLGEILSSGSTGSRSIWIRRENKRIWFHSPDTDNYNHR